MRERPPTFRINRNATLAKGLVFAGLGGGASTLMLADASGYGNHGTLTNMDPPTDWVWVPELGRWGLDFDGDECIVTANRMPITGDWAVACWYDISITASDITHPLFGMNETEVTRNRPMVFRCSTSVGREYVTIYTGFSNYSQATWTFNAQALGTFGGRHHLAITKLGTTHSLYRDGNEISTPVTSAQVVNWAGYNVQLFKHRTGYGIGKQSDPCIWNRALSPAEIQQLADPSNVMLSGLIQNPRTKFWPAVLSASTIRRPWQHRRHRRMTGAA